MGKLDFKAVARSALDSFDLVVAQWLPRGKYEGVEYVAINPVRADSKAGSFSVNRDTGVWCDFALNDVKGGDLISLVAYIDGIEQGEACKRLGDFLNMGTVTASSNSGNRPPPDMKPKKPKYKAVLPVPQNAVERMPQSHPSLGIASSYWDYLDSQGGFLCRINRFDGKGERGKEYRPLTYGESDNGLRWQWKALPPPRPMYNLNDLAQREAISVVLCEGEKACESAKLLFPNAVASTWISGSKAINETDFSPLHDRDVIYWPDNDQAGTESISQLRSALSPVGCKSFKVVDVSIFGRYWSRSQGQLEAGEADWPNKADAADAVSLGWTSTHIETLVQRNELLVLDTPPVEQAASKAIKPKARKKPAKSNNTDDTESKSRFSVSDKGLFVRNAEGEARRIAGRIDVIARSRTKEGVSWGVLVGFKDMDGVYKEWNIPMSLFATEGGAEIKKGLLDRGLEVVPTREAHKNLLAYLHGFDTNERVRLVDKLGWHENAFMLPKNVIGNLSTPLRYYSDSPPLCKISQKGSVEQWRDNVAKHCSGNDLLLFAISAAFAGPMLEQLGMESFGFHFVGDSSMGKSTLLKISATVFGSPSDYLKTWRATDNALESIAAAHSDCLLILDEIGQCDPRIIGETIYMLGNGEGKSRANDRGSARETHHRWRLVFLSSGEKALSDHMAESGKTPKAGQELRLLSLPASTHTNEVERRSKGIYQDLQGFDNGAELSNHLLTQCGRYFGTALEPFIQGIIDHDKNQLITYLTNNRASFSRAHLSGAAAGQARRAADKFAIVGAAGELATRLGITGWEKGEALRAADSCFKSWLDMRGGEGSHEERKILEQVRGHFEAYGESKYTRLVKRQASASVVDDDQLKADDHAPRTMDRCGYREDKEEASMADGKYTRTVYYVLPQQFKQVVCAGLDYKRVARLLQTIGALESNKGRLTLKKRIHGSGPSAVNVYAVDFAALFTKTAGID